MTTDLNFDELLRRADQEPPALLEVELGDIDFEELLRLAGGG